MDGAVHGRSAEAGDACHMSRTVELDLGRLQPDPLFARAVDGASQVAVEGAGAAGVGGEEGVVDDGSAAVERGGVFLKVEVDGKVELIVHGHPFAADALASGFPTRHTPDGVEGRLVAAAGETKNDAGIADEPLAVHHESGVEFALDVVVLGLQGVAYVVAEKLNQCFQTTGKFGFPLIGVAVDDCVRVLRLRAEGEEQQGGEGDEAVFHNA